MRRLAVVAGLTLAAVAGCSADVPEATRTTDSTPAAAGSRRPVEGSAPAVRFDGTVATGIDVPWGVTFAPDGAALVAERDTGRVRRVVAGGRRPVSGTVIGTVPGVRSAGEGGLLGLALVQRGTGVPPAPRTRLYAYLSCEEGDNRIVRMDVSGSGEGTRLGPATPVLTGIPWAYNHDGGRIVLGPDGRLWVGTGDAGESGNAQDRAALGGKILHLDLDGGVPENNPFGTLIWSYGHRNVQGLAFDSAGRLWATEFGQNSWDELNLIRQGGNHGWPVVEGNERALDGQADGPFVAPQVVWTTEEASPSGLAIVDDVAYVAGLRGARLWQVPLHGDGAGEPRSLFDNEFGRLRTVVEAPGGALWVSTSNRDGRGSPRGDDDRLLALRLS
jgi:glucose/arabinose dehydrogenase